MRRPRIWFDPPLFRWSRVVVVAALAAVAVIGWLAHQRGLWLEARAGVELAAAPAASAGPGAASRSAPSSAPGAAPAVAGVVLRPSVASPTPAAAVASARPPGPQEFEVCGLGIVPARDAGADGLDARLRRSRDAAGYIAWRDALLASPAAPARAAGLRLLAIASPADPQPVSRLAQLAHDSRDPMVYALALAACQQRTDKPSPGACQLLSPEQWTAIEPDNAVPWLHLAGVTRTDPREALFRAAHATRVSAHWGTLHTQVMTAQPGNAAPLDRLAMSGDALAIAIAQPLPPYAVPLKYCDAAAVRDVNRRQQCDALAELLATRGESLVDLAVARAFGERLGWPAERLQALRDERDALSLVQQAQTDSRDLFSCAAIDRQTAWFGEIARRGELGALRQALRRSGRGVEAWAAQARRERAAPAASAASAPG
jgi:hypothetical protein